MSLKKLYTSFYHLRLEISASFLPLHPISDYFLYVSLLSSYTLSLFTLTFAALLPTLLCASILLSWVTLTYLPHPDPIAVLFLLLPSIPHCVTLTSASASLCQVTPLLSSIELLLSLLSSLAYPPLPSSQ